MVLILIYFKLLHQKQFIVRGFGDNIVPTVHIYLIQDFELLKGPFRRQKHFLVSNQLS